MVDPKDDLLTYLRSEVNSDAFSVPFTNSDDIVFADYDGGAGPYPQIAVVSKDSITPRGGTTGATGIDPGGGGPIQDVIYLVQVDCWGGPSTDDTYSTHGSDPDTVANELAEEVASVCRTGTTNPPSGYEWMYCDPPMEADDTETSRTKHREIVTVRMKTTYTP